MPELTFTRASIARKQDGTQVASGEPRYEAGRHAQGITVEEATTNELLWSDDFDNAYWTKVRASVTPNAIAAPDGTLTADKLVEDTSVSNSHYFRRNGVHTVGQPGANGIIVKAAERTRFALGFGEGFGSNTWAIFNLSTVATENVNGVTAYIRDLGGGWYWCGIGDDSVLNTNFDDFWFVLMPATGNSTFYTGDGTSGIYIWRAQAEQKPYPTTPEKTEGATATRNAETLTFPTAGVLDNDKGTIEGWTKLFRSPGTNPQYLFDGGGAANENLKLYVTTAGRLECVYGTGAVDVTLTGTATLASNTLYHAALRWSAAGVTAHLYDAAGTTLLDTLTSATAPGITFGTLAHLGLSQAGTDHLDGIHDDLRISSIGRSDAEMAAVAASAADAPVDAYTTLKFPSDGTLVLSQHFAAGAPSTDRSIAFRYELLDSDNVHKAWLDSVLAASIAHNSLADYVKRTARFTLSEDPLIDWLSDRIKIWVTLDGTDYPQGVFLLSSPTRHHDGTVVVREVEAFDPGVILREDKVTERYVIAEGENYISGTNGATDLLVSAGITDHNLTPTDKTLPADREWAPGTPKATILGDIFGTINYRSLHFDHHGIAQGHPYVVPSERPADHIYADDADSIIFNGVEETLDLFGIPNVFVLYTSEPGLLPLRSVYVNDNPNSPTSTVRRGDWEIVDYRQVEAADQESLDAKTERVAFEASQIYVKRTFKTAIMPTHGDADVIDFTHSGLGTTGRSVEHTWGYPCITGGEMYHEVREVVAI